MACVTINNLPAGSAVLTGAELLPMDQSSVTRRTTAAKLAVSATTWNVAHTYVEGFFVKGSDDNIYRATSNSTGQDPVSLNPTYWAMVHLLANKTVLIPSDFATISSALSFFAPTSISEDAILTLQVEDGSYDLVDAQIELNHPYGRQIRLIGDPTTPANVTLTFTALPSPPTDSFASDSGSIYINGANAFGYINGFTISKADDPAVFGHAAILAYGNSALNIGPDMVINGFYAQLAAANGGLINAEGDPAGAPQLNTTTATSYGVYSDRGVINAPYVDIDTVASTSAVYIQNGGIVSMPSADLAGVESTTTVFEVNTGTLRATDATVGNAVLIINADGVAEFTDTGTTYGTMTNFANVSGHLTYNNYSVFASNENYATQVAITGFEFQAEGVAKTEALVTSTLEVGGGVSMSRIEFGQETMTAGEVTVTAPWITSGSVVTATYLASSGSAGSLGVVITDGASFEILDGSISYDGPIGWIAVVPV